MKHGNDKGIIFTDVCFITNDVLRLRAFYEAVFGVSAEGDEIHSGISIDGLTLVFDHVDIADDNPTFQYVGAGGANNVIIGFNVDDVDAEYKRLLSLGAEMLNKPTTHRAQPNSISIPRLTMPFAHQPSFLTDKYSTQMSIRSAIYLPNLRCARSRYSRRYPMQ